MSLEVQHLHLVSLLVILQFELEVTVELEGRMH